MNDDSNNRNQPEADGWVDGHSATEAYPAVGEQPPGPTPGQPPAPGPMAGVQGQGPGPRLSSSQAPELRPASPQHHAQQSHQDLPIARPDPYDVDGGKGMALLSHGSALTGLPLFIIPMLQKDNAFALHHAKAAGATYILLLLAAAAIIVTCGFGIVLLPLVYIPMVVGFVQAINGDVAGTWALGPMGESIFKGVQIDQPKQLESDDW